MSSFKSSENIQKKEDGPENLHTIICRGYVLESPRQCDSNSEAILIHIHNILFYHGEILKNFIFLILTQDSPHFYYMLCVNLGSLLYGDVSVMFALVFIRLSQSIGL